MDQLSLLAKATVKIVCDNNTSGTGFFYYVKVAKDINIPTIITNRHVVEGVKNIKLHFSLNDYFSSSEKNVDIFEVNFDISNVVTYHSDPSVDLCAINISSVLIHLSDNKLDYQMSSLSKENIPTEKELAKLRFVEDVMMIGYPNGISDIKNNFPIFRKGVTATHPAVDFEGREEFVMDMTVTPGSSGSPVFLYNPSGYNNGVTLELSERLIFLGINKAVFVIDSIGKIEEISTLSQSTTRIGINLGIIIKATAILDIDEQIRVLYSPIIANQQSN